MPFTVTVLPDQSNDQRRGGVIGHRDGAAGPNYLATRLSFQSIDDWKPLPLMLTLVPVIRPLWEITAVAPVNPAVVVLLIVPLFS